MNANHAEEESTIYSDNSDVVIDAQEDVAENDNVREATLVVN